MPKGRILTPDERLVIVREAAKGADVKGLAARFGVTRRTIHYTIKREKRSTPRHWDQNRRRKRHSDTGRDGSV